ncbi:site-2 protease family protein [Chromatium okenii]|uniref:site-2 protease family protein n=1 Tax=Chromatium okenii TaxID=61644 RepID=UPI0026ECDD9E|nr:site-2 protease family protein [Chromatium okenii]MBV5309605.1 site-2 protease family protein [Chromatium okenii]
MEFAQIINYLQFAAVLAIPVLLAITVHEAAHGWVANRLGDPTAQQLGRVTFNPIKHVDLVGTVVVPALTFVFLHGLLFGWAKPVPVTPHRLRQPRRDMALVALAGPAVNLLMALAWSLLIITAPMLALVSNGLATTLAHMSAAGVVVNLFLMALNLVPLLPLDGGRVMTGILPPRAAGWFYRAEPFGLVILLMLLMTGLLGSVLMPVVTGIVNLLPGSAMVNALFFH